MGKHVSPPCTPVAKNTATLQNKYHPELSENRAVWKSNNQGLKEATFIQTSGRGGDTDGVETQSGAERHRDMEQLREVHRSAEVKEH